MDTSGEGEATGGRAVVLVGSRAGRAEGEALETAKPTAVKLKVRISPLYGKSFRRF